MLAAGDCTDLPGEKTANAADITGLVAAKNISALLSGKAAADLQTYPVGLLGSSTVPFAGGAIMGRSFGLFQMGDDVQSGSVPVKIKVFIGFLGRKCVEGSWFWTWVLNGLKGMIISQLAGLAKKAAAAAN